MGYRVLWSETAIARVAEFTDFVARGDSKSARTALRDLFGRVQALADHPRLGRPLSEGADPSLRRLVAGTYVVVYQIRSTQEVVFILSVRHFRERPLAYEGV